MPLRRDGEAVDAGAVASGAKIEPGEPGEAFPREPLDAGDVPRPSTCRAASRPGPARADGVFWDRE